MAAGVELHILGAGPTGTMAGIAAAERGVPATIYERRGPHDPAHLYRTARRNVVRLEPSTVRELDRLGIGDRVFDGVHGSRAAAGPPAAVSIGHLEQVLRETAGERGVRIRFGVPDAVGRALADGRTGARGIVLDARGFAGAARYRRIGRTEHALVGTFTAATAPTRTPVAELHQGRILKTVATRSAGGVTVAYTPPRSIRRAEAAAQARWFSEVARAHGAAAAPIEPPVLVPFATRVRKGNSAVMAALRGDRLLRIGDAASTVHPVTGLGISGGLREARAAAELVSGFDRLGTRLGYGVRSAAHRAARVGNSLLTSQTAAVIGTLTAAATAWTLLQDDR